MRDIHVCCLKLTVAILFCASMLLGQESTDSQQGAASTDAVQNQRKEASDVPSDAAKWSPPPGFYDDRIVKPQHISKRPAIIRSIAVPFSALGSQIEKGLDYVEETQAIDRLVIILNHPNIRPLIGNLGDGSGFGGGVYLSTANAISPRFQLFGLGHITTKVYLQGQAGFRALPSAALGEKLEFTFTSELRLRPQEDFWGAGPQPGDIRTNYDLQDRTLTASVTYRPTRNWRFGTGLSYDSASVFRGKDERFPTTQSVFPVSGTPGLAEGAALLAPTVFIEYDRRQGFNAPIRGFYSYAAVSSNDSVGRGDFGYWSYTVDTRFYIPLFSDGRVLAARTLLLFNDPKGNSQIPFFRLARLGDSQTLRGYDSQRFHANNAAAWNVEYRTDLTGGIGAFAFTDFGQVFNNRSEFNTTNFRVTYGGGFQFKSRQSILLRVYLAKSEETTRFFFTFGPTF